MNVFYSKLTREGEDPDQSDGEECVFCCYPQETKGNNDDDNEIVENLLIYAALPETDKWFGTLLPVQDLDKGVNVTNPTEVGWEFIWKYQFLGRIMHSDEEFYKTYWSYCSLSDEEDSLMFTLITNEGEQIYQVELEYDEFEPDRWKQNPWTVVREMHLKNTNIELTNHKLTNKVEEHKQLEQQACRAKESTVSRLIDNFVVVNNEQCQEIARLRGEPTSTGLDINKRARADNDNDNDTSEEEPIEYSDREGATGGDEEEEALTPPPPESSSAPRASSQSRRVSQAFNSSQTVGKPSDDNDADEGHPKSQPKSQARNNTQSQDKDAAAEEMDVDEYDGDDAMTPE